MNTTIDVSRARAVGLLRDGAVTFVALLLAFAAFDDITTDNDTDFTTEYGALVIVAGWLLFVTFSLFRQSKPVLGAISLAVLAGAVWAQREIGLGMAPGYWTAYLVTVGAFLWFLIIAVVLLGSGWRARSERRQQAA